MGKVLLQLDKVDSTNAYALNLLSKNNPSDGTVISAWNQEQGRGQIGRKWLSDAGKNLTFSIIFYPSFLMARQQFIFNQAIALGLYDFLSQHFNDVKVKWPNDIYVGDKKVCGMLIQNVLSGASIQAAVVGIGLNVNQEVFDKDLPNPTSMSLEAKKEFDLEKVLEDLCERIETRYLQVRTGNHKLIQQAYLQNMYRFQEESMFQYPKGEIFSGKIVGLTDTGKLRIHNKKGEEVFDVRALKFVV